MSTTPFSLFVGFVFLHAAALAATAPATPPRPDAAVPAVFTHQPAKTLSVLKRGERAPAAGVPSNPRLVPASNPLRAGTASVRWALYYRAGAIRPPLVVSGDAHARFNWF